MANPLIQIRTFLGEALTELKKCSWPTRKELIGSTAVVIIATVVLGVYVSLMDFVIIAIVRYLTTV
jgi:preprotein translocase subunit SecE